MASNNNRYCFVNYSSIPYIQKFGIPCYAGPYKNHTYPVNAPKRTIIRNNQPTINNRYSEGFSLSKKKAEDCDCDDE